MIADYQQAVDYLYSSLPMFQRVGAAAYKKDLTNTLALCDFLDNPQNKFKSIHIAGTNGKGSVSHLLASILQSSGYKVGLYTSPHLKEFTERIRVNGDEIDQQFVIDFVNRIKPIAEKIKPSFFEITVVMAFEYFVNRGVDVAVIEVGLGGRLDSTNVITPELSVITNIGNDHADLLGDTPEKIAYEKAGIIKHGIPVIISERQQNLLSLFQQIASDREASLTVASDRFVIKHIDHRFANTYSILDTIGNKSYSIKLPLLGAYQSKNILGVLESVNVLRDCGFVISDENLLHGCASVLSQTHLKGRWQKLLDNPLTICDTGHNEDGIRTIFEQIATLSFKELHIVWGMVKDKDPTPILRLLPQQAKYYFCQAQIPRALPVNELSAMAKKFGLNGISAGNVNDAIRIARESSSPEDFIFVGGSTFVVAEIENL